MYVLYNLLYKTLTTLHNTEYKILQKKLYCYVFAFIPSPYRKFMFKVNECFTR